MTAGTSAANPPKWRPAPRELQDTFAAAIASISGAEPRRMFGYPCAFVHGQMFAGVHQESVIVRLPADQRAEVLRMPGATQFEPMAGRPMREYVVLPTTVVGDPAQLMSWLERAYAFANSLPAKTARQAKVRATRG